MSRPDDESHTDSTWRQIVENYGERARLDPEDDPTGGRASPEPDPAPAPPTYGVEVAVPDDDPDDDPVDEVPEVERFSPPEPPPVPIPSTWERRVAWGGVFGAPGILLLVTLLGIGLPAVLGWGLVAWFVGGFLYLVATMPRTPREPWDDGSRV